MPYLAPPREQLTPQQVRLGFDYVLAVQAGDDVAAAGLASEVQKLPALLAVVAEMVIFPVTALSDDTTDPCADSFALDELGVVFIAALREWAVHSPATAAPGIARNIVRFTAQVLADRPGDVAGTLEAIRDEHLAQTAAAHPVVRHR